MVRGFILGVILLAVIGVCTVMETSKQTQARYLLHDLTRREDDAKKRLSRLHAEEQKLRSPFRLAQLVRKNHPHLVSLGSAAAEAAEKAPARRPGRVADEEAERTGNGDASLASVGQW